MVFPGEGTDDIGAEILPGVDESQIMQMLEGMPDGDLFRVRDSARAVLDREEGAEGTRELAMLQTSLLPKELTFEGFEPDKHVQGADDFEVKLTEDQEERLMKIVEYHVEQLMSDAEPYNEAVDLYRKIYDMSQFQRRDDPYKDAANIHLGIPATKVDTFSAKAVRNILSIPRSSIVTGMADGLDETASQVSDLLYWHHIKIDPIREVFHHGIKQSGIEGNGVLYVPFMYDRTKVTMFKSYDSRDSFRLDFEKKPEGMNKETERQYYKLLKKFKKNKFRSVNKVKVSYDKDVVNNPIGEVIPTDRFLTNANKIDFSDATIIGHFCTDMKFSYLERMWQDNVFRNRDKFVAKIDEESETQEHMHNDHVVYDMLFYIALDDDEEPQWYRLIFSLGDDNGAEKCFLSVRTYEAFHQECNYVNICPYPKYDGTWRGYSLIERSWMLSQYLDELINDGFWANKLATKPFVLLDEDSSMELGEDFALTPGGYLYAAKGERFEIQKFPPPPFVSEKYMEIISRYLDSLVGINELAEGQNLSSDPNSTASKALAILNEGLIRIEDPIENIKHTSLAKYNSLILKWYYQYKPNGIFYRRILGSGEVTFESKYLKADQYTLDLDFAPLPQTSTFNREIIKEDLAYLYTILTNSPFFNKYPQLQWNLIRDMAQMTNLPDVDDYVPSKKEMQQVVKDTAAIGVEEFYQQQQARQAEIDKAAQEQNAMIAQNQMRDKQIANDAANKALFADSLNRNLKNRISSASNAVPSNTANQRQTALNILGGEI